MELTRRQFLKAAGAATVAGVVFAGCAIPERELIKQSPRDVPEDLVLGLDDWYATSCALCGDGHGIIVRVVEGRAKKIEGNPDHPVNRGKLVARCLAGVQALYHPDRLPGPLRLQTGALRGSGDFQPMADWQTARDELVRRLRAADPARTVLITDPLRGHLGYVVLTFAQATGIRHLALEPVEQTVLRAAVKEVYGQDRLPTFDIANARSLLSIGADFLETWLSPVQYNRAYGEFRQGRGRPRGIFIQADSRFSMTAANADTWLPVAPGQEGVLALSIAHVLVSERLADPVAASQLLPGGTASLAAYAPEAVAAQIGATRDAVTAEKIREVAKVLAANKPALVIAGGSAAARSNGLFNVKAALALNYLL
ncbi:MAG: molybdopterin-dependent oxidoreductase, partial [Chloroflexi bacterium]|nr:molybdopterin-dependent oxidoreductase [Chloroflexota bacterium]